VPSTRFELLSVSFIEREQPRAAVRRLSHFQRGIFTMKNLMMVTAAVLLLSSAQARADFLADSIYKVSANALRNATRNGRPVAMNDSRALQVVLDSSWRSCLKDQIEWVDSCVRIALNAPAPLARPPQTQKDVQPLVDRCERGGGRSRSWRLTSKTGPSSRRHIPDEHP
jgi:myo-inositol catabolism protein IolC